VLDWDGQIVIDKCWKFTGLAVLQYCQICTWICTYYSTFAMYIWHMVHAWMATAKQKPPNRSGSMSHVLPTEITSFFTACTGSTSQDLLV